MRKVTCNHFAAGSLIAVAIFLLSCLCPFGAVYGQGTDTIEACVVEADTAQVCAEQPWPQNVQTRIADLLADNMFETSTVGMLVYDLTADSILFKYNERQLMRPASSLKMIVAVAALDRLGAGYEYTTRLYHTGHIVGNVLDGDIYCKGGFDPAFGVSDLDSLANCLRALGIDTVRGDVVADVSMKDDDRMGEGWCWDDDNPVLSPLLVEREDNFAMRFVERLYAAGITVTGGCVVGHVPQRAHLLRLVSRSFADILPEMMKESDNLYSESVFYNLAASLWPSSTVTAKHGRKAVNKLIERLGFNPENYYIADGSGLSLYNYVSPELEVAFLRYAYLRDNVYVPLYVSMPVAGIDGTLEKRMRRGYAHGNVHAKTGTVTGVSALAGYCTAANGHTLCFSIINMGIRKAAQGRDFQDKVCEALCRP